MQMNSSVADRMFREVGDWEHFLLYWKKATTVPEAIGLLHEGGKIPGVYSERERYTVFERQEAERRIPFYIAWSRHWHPRIAGAAQQVLVLRLLHVVSLETHNLATVHIPMLQFLAEVSRPNTSVPGYGAALLKMPAPRHVQTYLTEVVSAWRPQEGIGDPKLREILREPAVSESIIRATLGWGLGRLIARTGDLTFLLDTIIPAMQKFLEERGSRFFELDLDADNKTPGADPLVGHNFIELRREVNARAWLALVRAVGWVTCDAGAILGLK